MGSVFCFSVSLSSCVSSGAIRVLRTALLALDPGSRRIRSPGAGGCRRSLCRRGARIARQRRRRGGAGASGLAIRAIRGRRSRRPSWSTATSSSGQTAAILLYLGPRLGLAGVGRGRRALDASTPTHHRRCGGRGARHAPSAVDGPLLRRPARGGAGARESVSRGAHPEVPGLVRAILQRNPAGDLHLVGDVLTYADLSLFQLVSGLRYAFPKATARALARTPAVAKLATNVEPPAACARLSAEPAPHRLQRGRHLPGVSRTRRLSGPAGFSRSVLRACAVPRRRAHCAARR